MALNGMNKWIRRFFGGIIGVFLLFLGIERKKKETIEEQELLLLLTTLSLALTACQTTNPSSERLPFPISPSARPELLTIPTEITTFHQYEPVGILC